MICSRQNLRGHKSGWACADDGDVFARVHATGIASIARGVKAIYGSMNMHGNS